MWCVRYGIGEMVEICWRPSNVVCAARPLPRRCRGTPRSAAPRWQRGIEHVCSSGAAHEEGAARQRCVGRRRTRGPMKGVKALFWRCPVWVIQCRGS